MRSKGDNSPPGRQSDLSRPFHLEVLCQELESRKKRNPKYSLRAFAHSLTLDPAALSRIMSNKRNLSLRAARNVVQALKLNPDVRVKFQHSVVQTFQKKTAQFFDSEDPTSRSSQLAGAEPPLCEAQQAEIEKSFVLEVAHIDPKRMPEARELLRTLARTLESIYGNYEQGVTLELRLDQVVVMPKLPH